MTAPPGGPQPGPGSDGRRHVDGSMSLLQHLMDRPLDPSYAAAAARREGAGLPPSTSMRSPLVIVAAVAVGFLLVVAALALRPSGTTASRAKQQLVEQVQARQAHGDDLARQVTDLSTQIQRVQAAALASQASQLSAELARLQLLTGAVAVRGPGVVLTVDDAASARSRGAAGDPRSSTGFPPGRVTSFDLQILANGLWQAGAEAMSINGQRLTARSAIRFAGDAILVDYRPLSPPYVITAVGSARDLQTGFAASAAGAYLKSLGDNYSVPSTLTGQDSVEVPRSPSPRLGVARPVTPAPPSTSPPAPTGTPTEAQPS